MRYLVTMVVCPHNARDNVLYWWESNRFWLLKNAKAWTNQKFEHHRHLLRPGDRLECRLWKGSFLIDEDTAWGTSEQV